MGWEDRNKPRDGIHQLLFTKYQSSVADENLDLEARMAATLNEKPDYEEDVSYH